MYRMTEKEETEFYQGKDKYVDKTMWGYESDYLTANVTMVLKDVEIVQSFSFGTENGLRFS
jgi:hypothetical protein